MNRLAVQALEKMETRKFKSKSKGHREGSCGALDTLSSSSTSDCAICLEKYIDGEVKDKWFLQHGLRMQLIYFSGVLRGWLLGVLCTEVVPLARLVALRANSASTAFCAPSEIARAFLQTTEWEVRDLTLQVATSVKLLFWGRTCKEVRVTSVLSSPGIFNTLREDDGAFKLC